MDGAQTVLAPTLAANRCVHAVSSEHACDVSGVVRAMGSSPAVVEGIAGELIRTQIASKVFGGPPAKVGRFTILDELGAGGMGIVLSAYDEKLDRRVALKFLHQRGVHDSGYHRRLVREAQAMARLSHPNVVTVHDIGIFDSSLFVAMEFVRGRNLRDWLTEAQREQGEILSVFSQAGEGLAAVHAAGIIHRDFKPDTEPARARKAVNTPQHASRHV